LDIIYRYDPFQAMEGRRFATPAEAIEALREGNHRFVEMVSRVHAEVVDGTESGPIVIPSSPLSLGLPLVSGKPPMQRPFGMILGCSDARVPIELIFGHSHNDLFVVRVAGNVLGTECLGSLEYAARNFAESLRLVLVLGHTGCGAVAAAVDLYLDPDAYRTIVDRLLVVVRVADKSLGRRTGPEFQTGPDYRQALWTMAVYLNAALTARDLSRELGERAEAMSPSYGVYNLITQRVEAAPGSEATFAPAPTNSNEFAELADRLADAVLRQK
jgi:carbonic anhydrase